MIGYILIVILTIIEIYYWVFWLPRNWRSSRECNEVVDVFKSIYGKDGILNKTNEK